MSVLKNWINPYYLRESTKKAIREDILSKPYVKYTCLDNFFREEKLDELISHHHHLAFSEAKDRYSGKDSELLPYDGAVVWAERDKHFGSDLFFSPLWHDYLAFISATELKRPDQTEIKLRYHRPNADGFWVHSDGFERKMSAICYFNKDWSIQDGGMIQLWKIESTKDPLAPLIENPIGRMDFLTQFVRIRTSTPGGGFSDQRAHDISLIDQFIPHYNRLFLCNFFNQDSLHSVSPSGPKERLGFVQWLF